MKNDISEVKTLCNEDHYCLEDGENKLCSFFKKCEREDCSWYEDHDIPCPICHHCTTAGLCENKSACPENVARKVNKQD